MAAVARVQGDVDQVVEAGERSGQGKLVNPGKKTEMDVGVARLGRRVETEQVGRGWRGRFRGCRGCPGSASRIVHENRHAPAAALVQRLDQAPETEGRVVVAGGYLRLILHDAQLRGHFPPHVFRCPDVGAAEVEANHRMARRPVPVLVDVQPLEQRVRCLEQLLAGVEEQALAEAAGPGEEKVLGPVDQAPDVRGLVDVVAVLLADLAEGLDADGESASGHGWRLFFRLSIRSEGFKIAVPQFGSGDERITGNASVPTSASLGRR